MNIKWKYLSLIVPGTYVAVSSLHWSDNQTTRIHSGIPTSVYPPGLQGLQYYEFGSVQFSRSVVSDSLQPHELQHTRPPCLSPTPRVYPNSCPLSQWCHSTISNSGDGPISSCVCVCVYTFHSEWCMEDKTFSDSFSLFPLIYLRGGEFAWACMCVLSKGMQ